MSETTPMTDQADAGPMQCKCEACKGDDSWDLAPTNTPPPKSKTYIPPQADANTFQSQQAFLDSLFPIAIDQVDFEKRKCPICWKPFGEKADVGFDNSEQPVKLRCGHAFGDKCLAHIFAVPKPSTVDLQPFSFRSRSNSLALGQHLQAFADQNLDKFADDTDMFIKMLEDSRQIKVGYQWFGTYWWPIMHWLLENGWDAADINLFENVVILDKKPLAPKKKGNYTNNTSNLVHALLEDTFAVPETEISHSSSSLSTFSASPSADLPHLQDKPSKAVPNAANIAMQSSPSLSKTPSLTDMEKDTGSLVSMYETSLYEHESKRKTDPERLSHPVVKLIARKLVVIHKAYQALDLSAKQHGEYEQKNYPDIIYSAALLHAEDLQVSSNEISTPKRAFLVDESVSGEKMFWEKTTFIVTRSFCKLCCTIDTKETTELAIPNSLWWKDDEDVPDGCPLCHKVLFEKGKGKCNS